MSAGKLLLRPTSLRLDTGSGHNRASSTVLHYGDHAGVETASIADRIRRRPTAIVQRIGGDSLSITAVDGLGSTREIVERLAAHLAPKATPSAT